MFADKWNKRFMEMAQLVASWSKDPSTQCGAVIVRPNKTIASVGYNGFPRGIADLDHLLREREFKYPRVIHAEMNAILNANEPVKGFSLYTWPGACCANCAKHIIQAGISTVVIRKVPQEEMNDKRLQASRWGAEWVISEAMFKEAEIELIPLIWK